MAGAGHRAVAELGAQAYAGGRGPASNNTLPAADKFWNASVCAAQRGSVNAARQGGGSKPFA
jgi:hypothetical protein